MSKQAEAARAARNQRLASTNATAPAAQSQTASNGTPVKTPAQAPAAPPVVTPPVQDSARELVARVVDPARIGAEAAISVSGPFNTKTANPHWIVLVDGEPYAKIALSDQDDKEKIAKVFVTEAYAAGIKAGTARMPLEQVMNNVKARPYIAAVRSTEAFAAVEGQAKEAAKHAFQKKSAQYRDDFMSMLNLAVAAQTSNFISENPLKDSMYKAMKSAGVHDPVPLIEAAYAEAAPSHFETLFRLASKWNDFTPEALADVKQEILGRPARSVRQAPVAHVPSTPVAPKPVPSSQHNVPLVASVSTASPDEKASVRQTFNFRGRMLRNEIRPK